MEELLERNIFDDNNLLKLSPDYNPSEVILQMQMRRSLVKETHCYKTRKTDCSRKTKNNSNVVSPAVNTDISALKNNNENKNMRNYINLKKTQKVLTKENQVAFERIETMVAHIDNDMRPATDTYLDDISKDTNDSDCHSFHKNDKQIKQILEDNRNLKPEGIKTSKTPIKSGTIPQEEVKNKASVEEMDDLQSLFIRMAISQTTDEETPQNASESNNEMQKVAANLILDTNLTPSRGPMDFLTIKHISVFENYRSKLLAKKYSDKWKNYAITKKKDKERQKALNYFFDKLDKRKDGQKNKNDLNNKAKLYAKDYNNYQHRYKMQQHVIALQKSKLEEQNRMIYELKYNKILEASKESVEAMKDEVRRTYFELDRHLKPKIKCLTNDLKIPEIAEPSLILHCLKVPQFLQRMEKRAREREEKHAIIRERRQQMEEERIRLKQQAELAKIEMDKEEKIKRLNELKEKRKKEKVETIRKKQHTERLRALLVLTDIHYERSLLLRYGLEPWRKLLVIKRENIEKAKSHYLSQLLKKTFLNWMWHTEDMNIERNYKADKLYRSKLLSICFISWKTVRNELVVKKQTAEDYYDFYVMRLVFRKFREVVEDMKKEQEAKMLRAQEYYNSNLLFRALSRWRSLPALGALRREQDARKARWRGRVLQVVPDYRPPDDL